MNEQQVKQLVEQLGDFCHTKYLGYTYENGQYNYGYENEVVYMIQQFFESEEGKRFIN